MSIEDDLKNDKIILMSHEQIAACPFLIMTPEHYNPDGSCKCSDREHAIMVEWGYHWDEQTQRWLGEEDEL